MNAPFFRPKLQENLSFEERLENVLRRLVEDEGREEVPDYLKNKFPLYGSDPNYPDYIIELQKDGRQFLGHVEDNRFVAERELK